MSSLDDAEMADTYRKIPDLHNTEIPVVMPLETRGKLEAIRDKFSGEYQAAASDPSRQYEMTPFLSKLSKRLHKEIDMGLKGTAVYVFDFTYRGNNLRYSLGIISWGTITNEQAWMLKGAYPQLQIGFTYDLVSLKMPVYVQLLALPAPAFLDVPGGKTYDEIFVGKQTWNGIMSQYV